MTLAVALVAVGTLVWVFRDAGAASSSSEPAARREPAVPRARDLQTIESSLRSGSLGRIRHTFAIPADVTLEPTFVRAVKSWRSVELLSDSYRGIDASTGQIEAVLQTSDGTTSRWTLRLDRVDGEWLVSGTRPAR